MTGSRKMRSLGMALAGVIVLAAGTAVAAVGTSGGDAGSVTGTEAAPPPAGAALPSAPPAAARDAFAVFRRPASAADRLDGELARRLRAIGANPDLARAVVQAGDARDRHYL
ncbi:MAG TPA: hypothetical protein VF250_10760, partial [Conexibacter sp.]